MIGHIAKSHFGHVSVSNSAPSVRKVLAKLELEP